MLETAPDEMYGGAAARQDTMGKGMDIVRAGAESLDEVIAVLGARGDMLG